MSSARKPGRFPYEWIILILVMALLFATNPSEQQFTSYLKNKIQKKAEKEDTLTGRLKRVFSGPAASIAGMNTVRTNYYLYSVYKIDILEEKYLYLGIFDHFINLK